MNRNRLLVVLLLLTALAAVSCASSNKHSKPTPTQSAASATASATSDDPIDSIIRGLVLNEIGPTFKDLPMRSENLTIRDKHYYTDSSGTSWIAFGAEVTFEDGSELAVGVVKQASGGTKWELVALGTGPLPETIPDDVKNGLGIKW